jgi:hypothetical protein
MTKVFYVPGRTEIIDYAREIAPDVWATRCRMLMLPELQICHPGAILGDEETFLIDQEAKHGTTPAKITADRYKHAFSHLAVADFAADGRFESFKLERCEVGNVTRIFVHCQDDYWMFLGLANLPHHVIVQRLASARSAL